MIVAGSESDDDKSVDDKSEWERLSDFRMNPMSIESQVIVTGCHEHFVVFFFIDFFGLLLLFLVGLLLFLLDY